MHCEVEAGLKYINLFLDRRVMNWFRVV
jgi:hypothetical protein